MYVVQLTLKTSLYLLGKHTSYTLRVSKHNYQRPYLTDGLILQKRAN